MLVSFVHADGTPYVLPVRQAVVYADDGQPVAVTYEHAGLIVHTDLTKPDFAQQCAMLRIKRLDQTK